MFGFWAGVNVFLVFVFHFCNWLESTISSLPVSQSSSLAYRLPTSAQHMSLWIRRLLFTSLPRSAKQDGLSHEKNLVNSSR